MAVAGPFRVLSEEGAETARTIALRLKELSWQSDRTASYLTGGVYRSRFLRDLFTSPELAAFLSSVAGTALAPHSMPSQQLYVNYAPEDITRHVDTWHTDSIGFDIVLMVTDPKAIKGGLFQFFRGTREAAARQLAAPVAGLIKGSNVELSSDQIESMPFPGPGYALFQQGNLVLHRATRLMEKGERITMVPGFVARDTRFADPTNVGSIVNWGEPGIPAELARHKAWFAHGRLEAVMSDLSMDATPREAAMALRHAIADASSLADLLEGAGGAETAS
ncbi:MAG: HalD/BesD family halogenase [Hypericibacter sp.]